MNRAIRNIQLFLFVLFGLLMLNLTYVQVFKSDWYINRPENHRVLNDQMFFNRGTIYTKNGPDQLAIAQTVPASGTSPRIRQYADPLMYSYVTGYLSNRTVDGLERSYNNYLSGSETAYTLRTLIDSAQGKERHGDNVITTIDPKLQQVVWDNVHDKQGMAVVLDAGTGDVLAMAGAPGFDPNQLANPATYDDYMKYGNDPAQGKPLLNPITSEVYPPGSVFKIITMAAVLESGLTPETAFLDPDVYQVPEGKQVNNYNRGSSCGRRKTITLAQAFTVSCNTTFAQAAERIGSQSLISMAEQFGFNQGVPWDIGTNDPSRMPTLLDPSGLADAAIGQFEVRATPLRMAMVAATIANGGIMMKPRIVTEITDVAGRTVATGEPPTETLNPKNGSKHIISEETSEQLSQMMHTVVRHGTGHAAKISGVDVAGKTGTAELGIPGKQPHSWFVGFISTPTRKVAVAVLVKEGGAGGGISTSIARKIFEVALNE